MFEAYKVGVTLSLKNQVSGILGFIARDFIKTDKEAKKLQATLKEIKLLGMGGAIIGGAGFLGLGALKATLEPAKEYVHQLVRANAALKNTSPAQRQLEIAQMTAEAWKTTGKVMTTTASGNLATLQELRMVFRGTAGAVEHLATVQKIQAVLKSVRGEGAKDEAYDVAKALEMKGDVLSSAKFDVAANMMVKAMIASGGKVTAADFHTALKYGRGATLGWNNEFAFEILPTLIQELKTKGGGGASGAGNAMASGYATVVGGTIPQKSLKVWQKLGLLDPSKIVWDKVGSAKGVAPGGVSGSGLFQDNPFQWVQQILVPALEKNGFLTDKQKQQELKYLFPNRVAEFGMEQLALQGWKFTGDQKLDRQAGGIDTYNDLVKNDPVLADQMVTAQWKNLKTVIGIELVPVLLPFLHKLAEGLQSLTSFAREHPTLTKGLVATVGGLSALAAISGTLMIVGAGVRLIGVGFVAMQAVNLISLASGISLVTASLMAAGGLIYFHKEIADKIDDTAPGIGDRLLKIKNWFGGASDQFRQQMGHNKNIQVNSQINLDGRLVGQAVTQHNVNAANKPTNSAGFYDIKQSFTSPAYAF